jgi:DnaJ-class molecular chaperone
MAKCQNCGGKGKTYGYFKCHTCGGTGEVRPGTCPECNGRGITPFAEGTTLCRQCKGTGKVN